MSKQRISAFVVALVGAYSLLGCGNGNGKPAPAPVAMLVPLLADASDPGRNLANGISANGQVVVGACLTSKGFRAFRWMTNGAPLDLGVLAGYVESRAFATSADGSVVVGNSFGEESSRAFIWNAQQGLQPLGSLPDRYTSWCARSVSSDGSVIVGTASGRDEDFGTDFQTAFVWTQQTGFIFLGDFLPENFPGMTSAAYGVSADGDVVVVPSLLPLLSDEVASNDRRAMQDLREVA